MLLLIRVGVGASSDLDDNRLVRERCRARDNLTHKSRRQQLEKNRPKRTTTMTQSAQRCSQTMNGAHRAKWPPIRVRDMSLPSGDRSERRNLRRRRRQRCLRLTCVLGYAGTNMNVCASSDQTIISVLRYRLSARLASSFPFHRVALPLVARAHTHIYKRSQRQQVYKLACQPNQPLEPLKYALERRKPTAST